MNGWRFGYALGLVVLGTVPLLMPFRGLLDAEVWRWTGDDAARLLQLAVNTFILTIATAALSLPLGAWLAVLLFRTSFFGRRFFVLLLAMVLFVPLPVLVACWQGLLGDAGLWTRKMTPAIWIHTLAAIPWVTFIVGIGLAWVEPELEDEAAQIVGPWRVLALVTLPRARTSIMAAALFVVLQTAAEVGVTEMLQVTTLADEARTQFAVGDSAGLERTVLLSLPGLLLIWGVTLAVLAYLEAHLPPLSPPFRAQAPLSLGQPILRLVGAGLFLAILIVPLFHVVWMLGLSGHPSRWDWTTASHYLRSESRLLGKDLIATLATSAVAGFLTAGLALIGCWLARDCRWFRWLLFSVLTWAWVMPGSVVGIGLHGLIVAMPDGPWKDALYYGPSPAPLIWAQALRALPIAVVFLWPVVRMIPREWFEEARLGGAGAFSEFLHIVAPVTRRATLVTALAATALCLGEVAASPRVETPGWGSFTRMLLDRLHYGVDNSLAALSVLMLGSLAAGGLVVGILWKLIHEGPRRNTKNTS